MTLQDRVRKFFAEFLTSIGVRFFHLGVHPDTITLIGFILVLLASVFIATGQIQLGGLILLAGLPLDALDGAVARAMARTGKFGGLLDSSLDRYADGLIFGALIVFFSSENNTLMLIVTLIALLGSLTTSYVRARAGEAGVTVKIGLLDRMVRVVLLLIGLVFPITLNAVLIIIAVGSNITTIQRLLYAKQHMPDE